jgi:hypothetical protein
VFIATFNNLSAVSQCMKLSFIGGGKQQSSQPVLLQMSMSICNKWSVLQLNLAVLFCLQQTFTLDPHVSIFPEKTLYYIEVLGCLSPLLTIFQLYHSAWSSVLLVEENGKNHRAGFELTTLVVIGTDCTCSLKSNYHAIKMAIFIIILNPNTSI